MILILSLIGFYVGIQSFGDNMVSNQKTNLETTVAARVAQCYAIEGIYPPDLDYIKKYYGLFYDEAIFYIDYRPVAANIYPDYTIIQREKPVSNNMP